MRLTLLKSATSPNTDADRESHEFTYSLYPHAAGWRQAGTVQMAYSLNCPLYAVYEPAHKGNLPVELALARVDQGNVILEVVKKAEDSDNIILRLYECHNRRTKATLSFFKELAGVWECDLMENTLQEKSFDGNSLSFEIMPYEIKTFRLKV